MFAPYLITGVDFQVPGPTPRIPWMGFFTPWSEFSNGFPFGSNWSIYGALLNGLFIAISAGNAILAQKIMLSGVFFASIFMYIFIAKHITRKPIVAFAGAIIYAYGTSTVNYGTGIVWEYAFFPLVVYFLFNLLGSSPRYRDAALFAISIDFMIGYGLHLLIFVPLIIFTFFLLNLHESHDKAGYFIKSLKFLLGSLLIFLLSTPTFALALISLIPLPITISGQAVFERWISIVSINQFYINFSSIPLYNWFLLLGPYSEYIQPLVPIAGFVFPIMTAAALLQRRRSLKLALGFSTVLVLVLTLVVLIHYETGVFVWLYYNFSPMRLLRGAEGVEFVISFLVTILISITLSGLIQAIENHRRNSRMIMLRQLAVIGLCAILLLIFFLFVPAFDPKQQLRGEGYDYSGDKPEPVDSSYSLMLNWMDKHAEPGTFRYQVVPSLFSTLIALGSTSSSSFAPLQIGLPATSQYAYYSLGALLSGQTHLWGLMLAPANIKYVVVIWNTTETNFGMGATTWRATGEPSLQLGPSLNGDYRYYVELLGAQSDMKLVANESDFMIYENLDYLPHVAVFPSLSYVVGDLSAINDLAMGTNFSANSSMLVYGNQPVQYNPLLYADTVIFQNRNTADLALDNLSSASGITLFSYGSSQRTDIDHAWVQATPENNYILSQGRPTSGLLSPTKTFIETTGESELKVNFSISSKGVYDAWLNVLFSPQSTGDLAFLIDNKPLNHTVHANSQIMVGFKWIYLAALNLSSGQHMITIKSSDSYAAVSNLQIVVPKVLEQEESALSATLINKSIMNFFNDPSLFDVTYKNVSTAVSSYNLSQYIDGNSWGNLSIVNDGNVSPLSVQNTGLAASLSPRQVLGFMFPPEDRNFTGWDGMEFWVKTSTTETQVVLYHNLHQDIYDNTWVFSTIPGVWNRLLIPLEGNFSYIDGIQIHSVAESPEQNITIELNQINLLKAANTFVSTHVSLPVTENYSIAYIVNQAPIAPTLAIDGKPVPLSTVNNYSVNSLPVYLTSGYHNFTLTFEGANSPQCLTVSSKLWNTINEEPTIKNVTTSGNSEYTVNVTSGKPFFLMLGESYYSDWHAFLNGRELPHFYAYSYLNGYYVNETGTISIIIKYNGQGYLTIVWLGLGVLASVLIYIIFDVLFLKRLARIRTHLHFPRFPFWRVK